MSVKVSGLGKVKKNLKKKAKDLEVREDRLERKGADKVTSYAKKYVPVRTGETRRKITTEKGSEGYSSVSKAEHSYWLENGSRGRPGVFYMRRAMDSYKKEFVSDIKKDLSKRL